MADMIGLLIRVLVRYLVFVGFSAHVVLVVLLVYHPDYLYAAESKLILFFGVQESKKVDIHEEINSVFGVWDSSVSTVVGANKVLIGTREFPSLQSAVDSLQSGDTIYIGSGVYTTPVVIKKDNVSVIGRGHVVFDGVAAEGKATFVVKGNNFLIENIECKAVRVPDGNGSCIRMEGSNLIVNHVYFHDSEQGILTGSEPGILKINDSRFELLGKSGQAHGLYMGGGELYIADSLFIASVDEGHEIKSRAKITKIERSVLASLAGNDSRLVDIPNGGVLKITDSVLEKGFGTSNADLIGYGLEGIRHKYNNLELKNNIIIMERKGVNRLINSKGDWGDPDVFFNVIISDVQPDFSAGNVWYESREKSGLKDYPFIPFKMER